MNCADAILAARERRGQLIQQLSREKRIVSIRANIPGRNKNTGEARLLVRHFASVVSAEVMGEVHTLDSADGPTVLIAANRQGEALKKRMTEIEENHPLGRFVDIDVFHDGQSLSRGYLRKCFLCGQPAAVCGRGNTHTTEELLNELSAKTRLHFSNLLENALKESMTEELDLHPKFGLVTPFTNGSHTDLTYESMSAARDAIIKPLARAFWKGVDCGGLEMLLEEIRPIGLEAERLMYTAANANAYKGLIYIAGLLTAACGYALSRDGVYDGVFGALARMTRNALCEFNCEPSTFGAEAYGKYGIAGVRGEAMKGFPSVRAIAEISAGGNENLLKALVYAVGSIDDTVLLKRSGSLERYNYFKSKIAFVDVSDAQAVEALNEECVKNRISIGGSADTLAAGIYINKIRLIWRFEKGDYYEKIF